MADEGSARRRRFLALWFPSLPVARVRMADTAAEHTAIVVVDSVGNRPRVVAVDAAARALGIATGTILTRTQRAMPGLAVVVSDPTVDAALLDRIADGCAWTVPRVIVDGDDAILLDIADATDGPVAEQALAAAMVARIEAAGLDVRHATAATAEAAHALARCPNMPARDEDAAIRRLPVMALMLDTALADVLRDDGLCTIGALLARPAGAIAARYGDGIAAALACLTGHSGTCIARRWPCAERMFEQRVDQGGLADAVRSLVDETVTALAALDRGARRFVLRLSYGDALVDSITAITSLPTRDPAVVTAMFSARIAMLGDGVTALRLELPKLELVPCSQLALEGGQGAVGVAGLADRVIRARATHRPRQTARSTSVTAQRQTRLPLGI